MAKRNYTRRREPLLRVMSEVLNGTKGDSQMHEDMRAWYKKDPAKFVGTYTALLRMHQTAAASDAEEKAKEVDEGSERCLVAIEDLLNEYHQSRSEEHSRKS